MYFYACFGPSRNDPFSKVIVAVYFATSHREARYNFRRDYFFEEGDIKLSRVSPEEALRISSLIGLPPVSCKVPQKSGYHYNKKRNASLLV